MGRAVSEPAVEGVEEPEVVAPKIFGFDMGATDVTEGHWRLAFGAWHLFIMPAVGRNKGHSWWEVSTRDGSTTIASGYKPTPEDAAQAIEDYLTELGNLIAEWHANAMKVAGANV